mmetsp:Transcript_154483/g.296573  ORF Transcript_154483/g.296573 Transcript_154483/m.296573 type:complete len:107 (-) Transcript_154483:1140-1460(-)
MANFCSAIVHAVCLAPVVIILSCWVTGCEEKSAVCTTRSLDAAERSLKSISGKNPEEGEGSLVFFQGKLDKKKHQSPQSSIRYLLQVACRFRESWAEGNECDDAVH